MAIRTVGIIGAGTMGGGIATSLAQHGFAVLLHDTRSGAAEAAIGQARGFYARAVEKGRMAADAARTAERHLSDAPTLDGLAPADLVIEAVFEDLSLKAEVLAALSRNVGPDTLIATNTSCLRVRDLAAHVKGPERFLGLHYFSPAQINPIVEVVQGPATADASIDEGLAFARAHGKEPLRCADSYGFAINRFFCPYTNEAARALDDGLGSTAEIDAVARDVLGAAAGPFAVMNLIKPRINLHAIRNLGPLGAFYAPAASMVAVGEADAAWPIGEPTAVPAARHDSIADRLLGGCFLPVLQALDEAVAAPAAFDTGATSALKFAKPPCASMDRVGRHEVERIIEPLLMRHGGEVPASLARVGRLLERS